MRNKGKLFLSALTAVLLSVTVTGCENGREALLKESLVDVEGRNFGTSTAEYGDLAVEETFSGEIYYPIRTEVTCDVDGCAMKEVVVKQGDHVKKGDLIAKVEAVSTDQRAEKQKQIDQKQTELQNVRNYTNQEIASLQQTMNAASDPNEQKICQLKINEQQMILSHMEEDYAEDIAVMEQEMGQIQAVESVSDVVAPYDGVIDNAYAISEGTILTKDRVIAEMYSAETILIKAKNPGSIRYGQSVTVMAGVGDLRTEYAGTVVGADNALQDAVKDGSLYIRLEGEYDPNALTNIEVKAVGYQVKNVLTVKSNAVFERKGQHYVYLLKDGELMERHVIVGASDGKSTWILQGLSEGDVISIQ